MRTQKLAGLILTVGAVGWAQSPASSVAGEPDRSASYYNYTLAHLYANQAAEGIDSTANIDQAITAYKAAIAADPRSAVLAEELTEFYIQFNRANQARTEAEAAIQKNPNDIVAHRMLARIFVGMISSQSSQPNQRVDPAMLRRATEEYQKVVDLDPKDVASWVTLGRLQRASENVDAAGRSFDKALAVDPENEDALVGRAQVFADKGDVEAAAAMFEKAAQKNPTAESWQRLAAAYEQLKEYKLAAETIRRALALNPENSADLRKALAQDLINAGEYADAIGAYEGVAGDDPEDAESLLRISQLYLQTGDLVKAREAQTKALAVDPESIEIALNEVSLRQGEGKPREAITKLKEILDGIVRPNYSAQQRARRIDLLERLAVMHRMMDQADDAVAVYREILALDPNVEARIASEIVDTYRGGKKLPEAQKESDAAIKKFPKDRGVIVSRASLDADMGRVDIATADVKKLLDGTDDRAVYLTLAELYEKGKKFDDARKALDEAEKRSPEQGDKISVWFMRGAMFEKMKNLPLAEAEFRKVLGIVPDHTATLNYLGYMLTDRNTRLNEALGMIEKVIAREPNNGAYLDSLGWAYYRLGRFAQAEEQIRRAVELAPGDPTMNDHYGDSLIQQKKVKEAVAAWEEALKQWQASAPAEKDQSEMDKVRNKLEQARKQLAR
jgi:tetratricopeptide (TPR) repeat protein